MLAVRPKKKESRVREKRVESEQERSLSPPRHSQIGCPGSGRVCVDVVDLMSLQCVLGAPTVCREWSRVASCRLVRVCRCCLPLPLSPPPPVSCCRCSFWRLQRSAAKVDSSRRITRRRLGPEAHQHQGGLRKLLPGRDTHTHRWDEAHAHANKSAPKWETTYARKCKNNRRRKVN